MVEHVLYDCPGTAESGCPAAQDEPRTCNYCDGGLALCTVCGGAEGSMPSECPGRSMTHREQELVFSGVTDFYDGSWHEPRTPEPAAADEPIEEIPF